ncbi:MAG: copper transporter [Acidimicrobiia bacterium]
MINLRYHIVSLTAVFLAIGIGLTLGSTFLDRATVENLQGQLQSLEGRLDERNEQIGDLQSELDQAQALQDALDEQGTGLLADRLGPVPVVVVASEGVEEDDVDGAVGALEAAGAEVQGLWWLQERFLLAGDADVTDLASALEEDSNDPARLRRMAVDVLGDALRERQLEEGDDPAAVDDEGGTTGSAGELPIVPEAPLAPEDPEGAAPGQDPAEGSEAPTEGEAAAPEGLEELPEVQALFDAGFISFESIAEGADAPALPAGVRVVLVGGSPTVPDDVVLRPLLDRIVDDVEEPLDTVLTSALGAEGQVSEIVAAVRDDDRLRSLVSTVDDIERFQGWVALVLAVEDLDDGVVGHYGLGEGASSLLPPLQAP